jgi:protein phosphatase
MTEIEAAGHTDPGPNRPTNEDSTGSHSPDDPIILERKGFVCAVADGVGGHQAGEVASSVAVSTVIEEYYSPTSHSRIEPALHHAFQAANLRIHALAQRNPEYRTMETTLTALVIWGACAYVAHVGDSRVYHWRDGRLVQLTTDHSEAAELARMRVVRPEQLRDHPRRNVLTRTMGGRLIVRPDFHRQALEPGDQFVLCTDGLWSEVGDEEIAAALGELEPAGACRALVSLALARPCLDNVTVQVVKVVAIEPTAGARSQNAQNGWLAGIFQRIARAS